jgi:hypothetical protein
MPSRVAAAFLENPNAGSRNEHWLSIDASIRTSP